MTQVGQRIAAVANRPDYAWEFRVIDKNVANAFALPGGKVAVYTGLFPYTQPEDRDGLSLWARDSSSLLRCSRALDKGDLA